MSTIAKNFTPDQNFTLMKNQIIAANVGLTNYNVGSDTRAILEAVSIIASIIGNDQIETARKSIPTALYDGLKFTKKSAQVSSGFLRFFRLPIFYITYTGADLDVQLSISPTEVTLVTSGTPADDLTVDFATYTTLDAVVAQIDTQTNYTAIKVKDSALTNLYQYSGVQLVSTLNYLNIDDTRDITDVGDTLINVLSGSQASIDDVTIQTSAAGTIAAGDATSGQIAALSIQTGAQADVNIAAVAIDTLNGNGTLISSNVGDYVVNNSAYANGQAAETDVERAERYQTAIQGQHGGTLLGIESDILALDSIKSTKMRERYPVAGTNTIVADDGTGNLSVDQIAEINTLIVGDPNDLVNSPGKGVAGIIYNIEAPNVDVISFAYTITRIGSVTDQTEIETAVQTVIEQYVNTRRLGENVVLTEIIKRAKSSHPAIYDFDLTSHSVNISVNDSSVARTGAAVGGTLTPTMVTLSSTP